ncbi:nuclear transport factor 2 family protein [Streptomyces sp. SID8499]|uniref:nuclear transport factor 2 family protein n=1 Tax=Streptomyces sp. SID8499 TaxID=2706106 RepID=UPI0013A95BF6|nr:nuclear transport factor 2 family protein [Streptomyces sp. SID8499]MYS48324.1 limonene-1,2-epoxide hydrolase [Streptomyces sp. SID5998]NED37188.1 limonene-1,2-epoxide hydrolase [Streptomyces sp. SID8499]NED73088.1 limonene-1,2-epoxide hydrolase [Streptomyces sp. SID9944]
MTSTDPRAVVIRYVEAVRDGALDVVRDSFAADATWHYPGDLPISKVWHGRDEIIDEFLGGMGPLLAPGTMEIELVGTIAEGDRVMAEWTSRAKTVHGAAYDNRCAGIYTVRDGKITSVVEYTDTRHVAATLFPDHDDHRPAETK